MLRTDPELLGQKTVGPSDDRSRFEATARPHKFYRMQTKCTQD